MENLFGPFLTLLGQAYRNPVTREPAEKMILAMAEEAHRHVEPGPVKDFLRAGLSALEMLEKADDGVGVERG